MRKINYLLMSVVAAHLFTESGVYAMPPAGGDITESLISSWSSSDHSAFQAEHASDFEYFNKVFSLASDRLDMAKRIATMDSNLIKLLGQNMDWLLDGVPETDRSVRQDKLMRISKRPADIGLAEFVETEFFSKLDSNTKKSEAFSAFRFSAREMKKPVILKGNYASVDEQLLASKEFGSGAKKAAFEKAQADGIVQGLSSLDDVRAAVDFYKQKKNQTEAAKLASVVSASYASWDVMPWASRQELIKKVDDAQKMVVDIRAAETAAKQADTSLAIDAVSDLRLIDYILGSTQIQPISQYNVASIVNDVSNRETQSINMVPAFVPVELKPEWKNADANGRRAMNEFFAANPDRNSVYSFAIAKGIIDPLSFDDESKAAVNALITALRAFDANANIMNAVPEYLFQHLDDSMSATDKKATVLKYLELPAEGAVSNKRIVELSSQNAWIAASQTYADYNQFFHVMKGRYDMYAADLAAQSSWQHAWIEANVSGLTADQKAKIRQALGNGDASTAPIFDATYYPRDAFISETLWQEKAMWFHWKTGTLADAHVMEWLATLAYIPADDTVSVSMQYEAYRQEHPVILQADEILARVLNTTTEGAISAAMANPSDPIISFFVLGLFEDPSWEGVAPVFNPESSALYNEAMALMRIPASTTPQKTVDILKDLKADKQNLMAALPVPGVYIDGYDNMPMHLLSIGMTDGDILPFAEEETLPIKTATQSDDEYIKDLAKFFVLRSIDAFEGDAAHDAMSITEQPRKLYELKDLFSFDSANAAGRSDYMRDVLDMHQALMGIPTAAGTPYSYLMSGLSNISGTSNAKKGLIIKYLLDSGFHSGDIKAPSSGDVAGMVPSLLERATFIALKSIGALEGSGLTGTDINAMMSYFRDELYRLRVIKDTFVFTVSEDASYSKAERISLLDSILAIEEVIPASFYMKSNGSMFDKSTLLGHMRSMTPAQISLAVENIGATQIPDHTSEYERKNYISSLVPTAPVAGSNPVGGTGTGGGDNSMGGGDDGTGGGDNSIGGGDDGTGGGDNSIGGGDNGGITAFGGDDGNG